MKITILEGTKDDEVIIVKPTDVKDNDDLISLLLLILFQQADEASKSTEDLLKRLHVANLCLNNMFIGKIDKIDDEDITQ